MQQFVALMKFVANNLLHFNLLHSFGARFCQKKKIVDSKMIKPENCCEIKNNIPISKMFQKTIQRQLNFIENMCTICGYSSFTILFQMKTDHNFSKTFQNATNCFTFKLDELCVSYYSCIEIQELQKSLFASAETIPLFLK